MKKKVFLLALPLLAVSLPLLFGFAANSPRNPAPEISESVRVASSPRAITESTDYDFGLMDPLTMGTHAFTIRNSGDAILELSPGGTTCKCTLSEISKPRLEPGDECQVHVTWNTGRDYTYYAHSATILTNDPRRKAIELRVQGSVRIQLAAAPAELLLDRVEPDQPSSASTLIISQVWDSFTIEQIRCTLEGAEWTLDAVSDDELKALEAKSAWRLELTVPAGLATGRFSGQLGLEVRPAGGLSTEALEVTVAGQVLRRLAVYGPEVDLTGTVDMGFVSSPEGLNKRLLLKVRDPQPDLAIGNIEVVPDFVKVSVTPRPSTSPAAGLYHLDIEIPANSPSCSYRGDTFGRLTIDVDHPRIDDLTLNLRFAVEGGPFAARKSN